MSNRHEMDEEARSRIKQLKLWKVLVKLSDRFRVVQDPQLCIHRWMLQELQQKSRFGYRGPVPYKEWVTIDAQYHAWDMDRGQYVYHK